MAPDLDRKEFVVPVNGRPVPSCGMIFCWMRRVAKATVNQADCRRISVGPVTRVAGRRARLLGASHLYSQRLRPKDLGRIAALSSQGAGQPPSPPSLERSAAEPQRWCR